nr:uncharacterized protein LOC109774689 [Aegilops tauschii subsp. strangulata]
MPTFDERGLVPPAPLMVPESTAPMDVSSGDSRKEEEEEEDAERDTEATPEGMGETSPLRKADILCTLPDDDDEDDVLPERKEPSVVPTRGRSALISRDGAPSLTPPGAASGPSAAPSSALGARTPVPQAARLSGFKLTKWRDYTAVDGPTPAAKTRKEDEATLLGARSPTMAAALSTDKGSDGARASPARSSSRCLGEHPREESAPVAPLALDVPTHGSVAEIAKAQELPSSQAMAAADSEKDREAVAQAAAACEEALKDAEAAKDRCRSLEVELETARRECAKEARGRKAEEEKMKAREDAVRDRDAELEQLAKAQATERGRLEELEQKLTAEKAELEAKAKVLAEDREAFKLLEALRSLYEKGLEESLAASNEGPAQLLPYLVDALEDVVSVVKGQVEALLKKFRAFSPAPSTGGATDPTTPAGGIGEGDAFEEEASLAGDGGDVRG